MKKFFTFMLSIVCVICICSCVSSRDSLSLSIVENNLKSDKPSIIVDVHNVSEKTYLSRDMYFVYHIVDGKWTLMQECESWIVKEPYLEIKPGETMQFEFDMSMFTFNEGETYRVRFDGDSEDSAFIDFTY